MKRRMNAILHQLGTAGVLGIGVLLACAAFWTSTLAPARTELAAQRAALEQLRARTPHQPIAGSGREDELRRFYSLFPPASSLTAELERLHRFARGARLDVAQGEYRLERRPAGLWAYRVTLPVRGTYGEVRTFVSAVLKDMPTASLDAVRVERRKADDAQLEAQLRFTLYARPSGDLL
jgi:hypothetical protein